MEYGYGLWALVRINSMLFVLFAVGLFHPATRRDWKAMGAFSAFIVALVTEMYGVPLTIHRLSAIFGDALDLSHSGGHLWSEVLAWPGDPHLGPFHLASYALIGGASGSSRPHGRSCGVPPAPTSWRPPAPVLELSGLDEAVVMEWEQ